MPKERKDTRSIAEQPGHRTFQACLLNNLQRANTLRGIYANDAVGCVCVCVSCRRCKGSAGGISFASARVIQSSTRGARKKHCKVRTARNSIRYLERKVSKLSGSSSTIFKRTFVGLREGPQIVFWRSVKRLIRFHVLRCADLFVTQVPRSLSFFVTTKFLIRLRVVIGFVAYYRTGYNEIVTAILCE